MTDPIRVVVADDHPLFREGVLHSLANKTGIVVVGQADTGEQALRLTREFLPDVLLLDIGMPGQGGLTTVSQVALACPVTKVVMLTVSENEDHLLAAFKAGARGYLLKGISARELAAAIRSTAGGEVCISPALAGRMLAELTSDKSSDPLSELTPRETEILGLVAIGLPGEALEMVERWLPQLESGSTADALAELGLGPLVRLDPPTYLAHAQRWAALPDKWARRFALALLRPLAADRHWDNIPGALVVIRRVMADPDADVRRAAAEVLAALAPKSPPEMARFLREQAGRSNSHTHWIVRHAMTALDPAAQAEIVKRLRS